MHKKVLNIFTFMAVFILFGISIYCIFEGTTASASEKTNIVKNENKTVYVDIKGAVNNPGVYEVDSNSRIIDVIKEALNNLDNSKIYRTDDDGSIMFKIKNNKLKIETCSP